MADRQISPESKAVGQRLKGLRVELGLKAEEVALRLSMSAGNYAHYESGRNQLSALDLPRFAEALRVDFDFLTARLGLSGQVPTSPAPSLENAAKVDALLRKHPVLGLRLAQVADEITSEDVGYVNWMLEQLKRRKQPPSE